MKNVDDVERYEASLRGKGWDEKRVAKRSRLFASCMPLDFWDWKIEDIKHNRELFDKHVVPYVERLGVAFKKGYGLLFFGGNGTGKTTFMSWTLQRAIESGRSGYYTTALQLEHDMRRGFVDRERMRRLDELLASDWLVIDEMNKEHWKSGDSFMRAQIERVLKQRFDSLLPTLLATNANVEQLREVLGESTLSILEGKYQYVALEAGDARKGIVRKKMLKDMGMGDGA